MNTKRRNETGGEGRTPNECYLAAREIRMLHGSSPSQGLPFRADVEKVPVPELSPGNVDVMDNLPAQKVIDVR